MNSRQIPEEEKWSECLIQQKEENQTSKRKNQRIVQTLTPKLQQKDHTIHLEVCHETFHIEPDDEENKCMQDQDNQWTNEQAEK